MGMQSLTACDVERAETRSQAMVQAALFIAGGPGLRGRRLALLAVVLFAATCACSRPTVDNLLFVSFDTTRADHLSVYGYEKPTSPNLEILARAGTTFANAYSHVPSTLPAHSSMFTGNLPPTHGVRCNGKFVLPQRELTLAEILREAGFATAAMLGAFPLDGRFGLSQGFDVYDDDFASSAMAARRRAERAANPLSWLGHSLLDFERGASGVTDAALRWLDGRRGPWFLFVHYFDPHAPYDPPVEWRNLFESPYDAEIAYTDHHLARLLRAVEAMPGRTLVVFTADHGEGLGEHLESEHNRYLYNTTVHVPLIVKFPGVVAKGRRIEATVGHVDLLPTILELLDVSVPTGLPGRSLAAALRGGPEPDERPHYAETLVGTLEVRAGREVRAIIRDGHKFVESHLNNRSFVTWELYDLVADPAELSSLASVSPERVAELGRELTVWSRELEEGAPPPVGIHLDEAAKERLRSLGYL